MCKNHGYRHTHPALVRVAALLSRDNAEIMEAMLDAATYTGMVGIRDGFAGLVDENIMVECAALMQAVRNQLRDKALEAQERALKAWGADVLLRIDEPPF